MASSWQDDPSDYLKSAIGAPVTITSGLRTPQHNALVGGVPNSDHLRGQAYDFVPQGMSMADAASRLQQSGVPTTKILNEGNHIHVSYPAQGQMAVSDDDILKSFVSGSAPKPASPNGGAASPAAGMSDDQVISSWAKAGNATASAPHAQAKPSVPGNLATSTQAIASKPFGFSDDIMAKIPFAKDVVAGGTALLDKGADFVSGKSGPSLGDTYQANMAALSQKQKAYEAAHPNLSPVATGLSVLASGKPSPGMLSAGTQTLGQLVKSGAKAGATVGGLFGLGTPTEGPQTVNGRAGNALVGAATGTATGAALPVAAAPVAAAGRYLGGLANKLIPSGENAAAAKANSLINEFSGGPLHINNGTELVPGSKPTLPEVTGNPGAAALYRTLRDLNPNSPLVARETENQAARGSAFENVAGTHEDIEALADARDKEASAARDHVFSSSNGGTTDVAPVVGKIQEILSGSSGNRPAVKTAMSDAMGMLHRDNGETITDPKTLYDSARKGINDLISGKDLTKSYGATAASQLISVRDALDEAIEKQAPGFKDYLSKYEEASGPIDALKFLQGQNITDAKGNLTLAKVQGAIKRLDQQQAAPGVKQGKSVTDAQRNVLESIRDDLLRAQNTSLGKAIGSNTVQNAIAQKRLGLAQHVNPTTGTVLGTGLGYVFGGPQGAEAGAAAGNALGGVANKIFNYSRVTPEMIQNHLEQQMLNPTQYVSPTQNVPIPSLNQILNSSRTQAFLSGANRLAISHEVQKRAAR